MCGKICVELRFLAEVLGFSFQMATFLDLVFIGTNPRYGYAIGLCSRTVVKIVPVLSAKIPGG